MLLRSSEGQIYRADSSDYGVSWGSAYPTGLPNNNSGIDVVRMEDGLLVLCMNPISENFGPRTPLVLMVSDDNGLHWQKERILEDAENPFSDAAAEYSYPCVIEAGKELYVSYTFNRKSIACNRLVRREYLMADTNHFPGGAWPVMLTPFTDQGAVDYDGLGKLIDWYMINGASGLFAVCQSSEVFFCPWRNG